MHSEHLKIKGRKEIESKSVKFFNLSLSNFETPSKIIIPIFRPKKIRKRQDGRPGGTRVSKRKFSGLQVFESEGGCLQLPQNLQNLEGSIHCC